MVSAPFMLISTTMAVFNMIKQMAAWQTSCTTNVPTFERSAKSTECYCDHGSVQIAGIFNFYMQNATTIDSRETILSEVFLYALDVFNAKEKSSGTSTKLGGVVYNSFLSQSMTMDATLSSVPSGFCESAQLLLNASTALNNTKSIAVTGSFGSQQANAISQLTLPYCMPVVTTYATGINFASYPLLVRSASSDQYMADAIIQDLANAGAARYGTDKPSVCIQEFIDFNGENWSSLEERIVYRPNTAPVVIILGTPSTTTNILTHLHHIYVKDTVQPFQFITTDQVDLFRLRKDSLSFVNGTIMVNYQTPAMNCDTFDYYVFNCNLTDRENPFAKRLIAQVNHCCLTNDVKQKRCTEEHGYCTGGENLSSLLHADFIRNDSRRIYDSVNIVAEALRRWTVSRQTQKHKQLCIHLGLQAESGDLMETASLNGSSLYQAMLKVLADGYPLHTAHNCTEEPMPRLADNSSTALPSFRYSILQLIDGVWFPIGKYDNSTNTFGVPNIEVWTETPVVPSLQEKINLYNIECTKNCPWYQSGCSEVESSTGFAGYTLTFMKPYPNVQLSDTCCIGCSSKCIIQIIQCHKINWMDWSFNPDNATLVYCDEKTSHLPYRYRVTCWCPHSLNQTANSIYGYAQADATYGNGVPNLDKFFIIVGWLTACAFIGLVVQLIRYWSTPIIRCAAPIAMLSLLITSIALALSVTLLNLNLLEGRCLIVPMIETTLLYAVYMLLSFKAVLLATIVHSNWGAVRFLLIFAASMLPQLVALILWRVYIRTEPMGQLWLYQANIDQPMFTRTCLYFGSTSTLVLVAPSTIVKLAVFPLLAWAMKNVKTIYGQYQLRRQLFGSVVILIIGTICFAVPYELNHTDDDVYEYVPRPNASYDVCIADKWLPWTYEPPSADDWSAQCEPNDNGRLAYFYKSTYSSGWIDQLMIILVTWSAVGSAVLPSLYMAQFEWQLNDVKFTCRLRAKQRQPPRRRRRASTTNVVQPSSLPPRVQVIKSEQVVVSGQKLSVTKPKPSVSAVTA